MKPLSEVATLLLVIQVQFRAVCTCSLVLVHLTPSCLFWTDIECTVHVALHKLPINQSKPVHKKRQQTLKAYCPNLYIHTVPLSDRGTADNIINNKRCFKNALT